MEHKWDGFVFMGEIFRGEASPSESLSPRLACRDFGDTSGPLEGDLLHCFDVNTLKVTVKESYEEFSKRCESSL